MVAQQVTAFAVQKHRIQTAGTLGVPAVFLWAKP